MSIRHPLGNLKKGNIPGASPRIWTRHPTMRAARRSVAASWTVLRQSVWFRPSIRCFISSKCEYCEWCIHAGYSIESFESRLYTSPTSSTDKFGFCASTNSGESELTASYDPRSWWSSTNCAWYDLSGVCRHLTLRLRIGSERNRTPHDTAKDRSFFLVAHV